MQPQAQRTPAAAREETVCVCVRHRLLLVWLLLTICYAAAGGTAARGGQQQTQHTPSVTVTDAGDTSSEHVTAKWQLLVTHVCVARLLRSVCFPVPPDEWLVRVAASWVVCGSASKCTSPWLVPPADRTSSKEVSLTCCCCCCYDGCPAQTHEGCACAHLQPAQLLTAVGRWAFGFGAVVAAAAEGGCYSGGCNP